MSKKICKAISFVLALLLLSSVFSICAFAATPTISVGGGSVTNGNEITVNVTLSASSNAAGGNFTLQYDSTKLSPVSYTSGSLVSGYTNNCNLSYSSDSIRFTFSGSNAIISSGTLVSLKFKAKATGSAALSFTAYKLYNTSGSSISASASGNKITVTSPTVTKYTVTFNGNGGSVSPTSITVDAGQSVTLPTPNTRSGYTCLGWSTSSSASSASYSCGASYTPTANITLYAVWKSSPSTYTLTYNANGGSGAPSSQTIPATISSTVPTNFPKTFLGWSTSSSATSATYKPGDTYSTASNTTLYAVWKAAATLSTSSSTSVTVSFANQVWLYKFTPSTSGTYTFESTGSSDTYVTLYSSSGSSLSTNDDGGTNSNFKLSYSLTSGTTYYLGFKCYGSKTGSFSVSVTAPATTTKYTVTYNANGGSVSPTSVTVDSGKSITLPTPTKSKNICLGWSTSSSATSASYSCGSSYTPKSNVTLYAVWKTQGCVRSVSIDDFTIKYKSTVKLNPVIAVDGDVKYKVEYKSGGKSGVNEAGYVTIDSNGNAYAADYGYGEVTCIVTDEFGNVVQDTCTVRIKYSFFQWLIIIFLFGWIWY